MVTARKPSTNRSAVQACVDSLRHEVALDAYDEALARLALTLADYLDEGAGMATAAVSKELRATLAALTAKEVIDNDDDIFSSDVPATIRHSSH